MRPDQPSAARFDHVESCESEEGRNAVEEFWLRAVDSRCEGLMIKVREYISMPRQIGKSSERFWTTAKFWKAWDRGRIYPGNNHYLQRMSLVRPEKCLVWGTV